MVEEHTDLSSVYIAQNWWYLLIQNISVSDSTTLNI